MIAIKILNGTVEVGYQRVRAFQYFSQLYSLSDLQFKWKGNSRIGKHGREFIQQALSLHRGQQTGTEANKPLRRKPKNICVKLSIEAGT